MKLESDLTKIIEDYFTTLGYIAYKEVLSGSKRSDLFLVRDNISIVVETKLNIGLKVIEQAFRWRLQSSYSYICVPYKHKTKYDFPLQICSDYGIGVIFYYEKRNEVVIKLEPSLNLDPILPKLYEEQRESVGGNGLSDYITPFKLTVRDFINYIKINPNIEIGIVIDNINHHYKSKSSARQSLLKMIKIGVIKNINVLGDKSKCFMIYVE